MDFLQAHLLSLVIFAPVLGAVVIAFLPGEEGGQECPQTDPQNHQNPLASGMASEPETLSDEGRKC